MTDSPTVVDRQLSAHMAEYESLRQESLQAVRSRVAIANLMFGVLALVLVGVFSGKVPSPFDAIVAIVVVPQFVRAAMWLALAEYNRSQRAGAYLCKLEETVNVLVERTVLGWEQHLRDEKAHMVDSYQRTGVMALFIIWISDAFGFWRLHVHATAENWHVAVLIGAAVPLIALEVWFLWEALTSWREATRGAWRD